MKVGDEATWRVCVGLTVVWVDWGCTLTEGVGDAVCLVCARAVGVAVSRGFVAVIVGSKALELGDSRGDTDEQEITSSSSIVAIK